MNVVHLYRLHESNMGRAFFLSALKAGLFRSLHSASVMDYASPSPFSLPPSPFSLSTKSCSEGISQLFTYGYIVLTSIIPCIVHLGVIQHLLLFRMLIIHLIDDAP